MLKKSNKKKNIINKKLRNKSKKIQKGKGKSYKNILQNDITIKKLDINYTTSSYNIYGIPEFWLQIFKDEEN